MIEGVNATIANAVLVRPVSDQAVNARSYAENPKQVQQVPQAPYISPYISMDYTNNKAVLQIRDSDSGEVIRQIPTDTQLKAYRRAAESPLSVVKQEGKKEASGQVDADATSQLASQPVAADTTVVNEVSSTPDAAAPIEISA